MKALRTALSVCSFIASIIFGILAVVYLVGGLSLIPHTITKSETINREFRIAATWVDDYAKLYGRLPTQEDFNVWAKPQSKRLRWVSEMRLFKSPQEIPEEATKEFGQLPAGGYILEVWRGEWSEYFSSWKHNSTIDTPAGLWGSTVLVSLMFLIGSIACWYLSRWCRSTRRSSGLPKASHLSSAEL